MSIREQFKAHVHLNKRDPFASWEWYDVQFPATPHTDLVIPHTLTVDEPKDVHYRVIKQFTAGTVYEAPSAVWTHEYVVLRSDVGGWTGRILLGVLDEEDDDFDESEFTIPVSVTPNAPTTTLTGDVTGSGQGTIVTTIQPQSVGLSDIVNVSGPTVLGRASDTGSIQSLGVGSGLSFTGDTLIATANQELGNVLPGKLIGRNSNTAGPAEPLDVGNGLAVVDSAVGFTNHTYGQLTVHQGVGNADLGIFAADQGDIWNWSRFDGTPAGGVFSTGSFSRLDAGGLNIIGSLDRDISGDYYETKFDIPRDYTLGNLGSVFALRVVTATSNPRFIGITAPGSNVNDGLIHLIINDSGNTFPLVHNYGAPGTKFYCPDQVDYYLYPGDSVLVKWVGAGFGGWTVMSGSKASWLLTWSPTWSSASNPQPTGSSITCWYRTIGKQVIGSFKQEFTSGTTFGTGLWEWTPPVAPVSGGYVVGSAHLFDAGTTNRIGTVTMVNGKFRITADNTVNNVGPSIPFTFTVNDYLQFNFSYPAA